MREAMTERPHPAGMGGVQKLFRFPNGYGASVVQFPYSYGGDRGLWELAVIRYSGEDNDSFSLTYDTPITNDVLGHLNEQDVDALLDQVAALEAPNAEFRPTHAASSREVAPGTEG
jgi:hypothetical protein